MTGYLELVGKITKLLAQEKEITERYEDLHLRIDKFRRDEDGTNFNKYQTEMKVLTDEELPLKYERTKIINERKLLGVELGVITNLQYLQQMDAVKKQDAETQKYRSECIARDDKHNDILFAILDEIKRHNEAIG
jgi:hypothetical protein